MAKRRKTQTLGEYLRELRNEREWSIARLKIELTRRLPEPLWVSDETLRRYEIDWYPIEKADPVLLTALADIYGVELGVIDLTRTATEGARQVGALLARCAPWESNPEPADFRKPLALAA